MAVLIIERPFDPSTTWQAAPTPPIMGMTDDDARVNAWGGAIALVL